MHVSAAFKSSPQCAASPDGRLIATLSSSTTVAIRSTETLQALHAVELPSDLTGPILTLRWSPSSAKVLVSTADQIHVLSPLDPSSQAVVRNPVSGTGKPSYMQFGENDTDLLVFSAFGLKLLVYNLSTCKATEIANPKFYHPSSAPRTFSLHPSTGHLALLTRIGGRDIASIHSPASRQLQRSWYPETADAQALSWSPDGQWLLLWESPAHGWRLLLYTPDGQLVRALGGSRDGEDEVAQLKPGIRLCQFSPNAHLCAVCDHGRKVAIFDTAAWRERFTFVHPPTISPSDTLQVWQEQLHGPVADQQLSRSFLRATQTLSPPAPPADSKQSADLKMGCSSALFDASSNLLATRLDESPSALWIWDLTAAELRAALILHSTVDFCWHPRIRELLLVICHDEAQRSVVFIWDPLSNGPKYLPVDEYFPEGKAKGKVQAAWINWEAENAALLLSDSHHYCLLWLSDTEDPPDHWQNEQTCHRLGLGSARSGLGPIQDGGDYLHAGTDDTSLLEDTFSFKHS